MDPKIPSDTTQKWSLLRRGWAGLGKAQIGAIIALLGLIAAVISTTTDVIDIGWLGGKGADSPGNPSASITQPTHIATSTPTTTSATYSGRPVELSAASAGSHKVAVTAQVHRAARAGYAYWLVLEVHNVSGTHSEFYPRQPLTESGNVSLSIPADADVSRRRTGTIFEVPEEVGIRFESGRPDPKDPSADFLLAPPCICAVSDEVELKF